MLFRDRAEAGQLLARALLVEQPELRALPTTVLAIPRGGVPVGAEIAAALEAPLDVFIARKLGAPGQEELGIGAVAADGTRVLDEALVRALGVSDGYIERVTAREIVEARRRVGLFRGARAANPVRGRAVILVDDGLATGGTARAALTVLRAEGPERLIFATPVGGAEGIESVRALGVTVVSAAIPKHFRGVGEWYEDFPQLTDDEVLEILREVWSRSGAP